MNNYIIIIHYLIYLNKIINKLNILLTFIKPLISFNNLFDIYNKCLKLYVNIF